MSFAFVQGDTDTSGVKKTRILYVDHAPVIGGAELSLLELVETLGPEYEVGVVCTNACPDFIAMLEKAGAQVFQAALPRMRGLSSALSVWKCVREMCACIRSFKPDIVHSNTVRAHVASAIAARICGVKVVWHIRDFTFPIRLYRMLLDLVDHVIFVSDAIGEVYGADCVEAKKSVVLNGIVPPDMDTGAARNDIRAEFGISPDAPVASCVGLLHPWKGQDCFLRAAALVKKRIPEARFLIVGDGPCDTYKTGLAELASDAGPDGTVIFAGFRHDALSFMCASDVVAHTSLDPEPFGRVLIEAMSVGTPIIASPYGGPAEIIEHGMSGLLVSPSDTEALADAICRVMSDVELARSLVNGGRERFDSAFHQDIETAAILDVYGGILS